MFPHLSGEGCQVLEIVFSTASGRSRWAVSNHKHKTHNTQPTKHSHSYNTQSTKHNQQNTTTSTQTNNSEHKQHTKHSQPSTITSTNTLHSQQSTTTTTQLTTHSHKHNRKHKQKHTTHTLTIVFSYTQFPRLEGRWWNGMAKKSARTVWLNNVCTLTVSVVASLLQVCGGKPVWGESIVIKHHGIKKQQGKVE